VAFWWWGWRSITPSCRSTPAVVSRKRHGRLTGADIFHAASDRVTMIVLVTPDPRSPHSSRDGGRHRHQVACSARSHWPRLAAPLAAPLGVMFLLPPMMLGFRRFRSSRSAASNGGHNASRLTDQSGERPRRRGRSPPDPDTRDSTQAAVPHPVEVIAMRSATPVLLLSICAGTLHAQGSPSQSATTDLPRQVGGALLLGCGVLRARRHDTRRRLG